MDGSWAPMEPASEHRNWLACGSYKSKCLLEFDAKLGDGDLKVELDAPEKEGRAWSFWIREAR